MPLLGFTLPFFRFGAMSLGVSASTDLRNASRVASIESAFGLCSLASLVGVESLEVGAHVVLALAVVRVSLGFWGGELGVVEADGASAHVVSAAAVSELVGKLLTSTASADVDLGRSDAVVWETAPDACFGAAPFVLVWL